MLSRSARPVHKSSKMQLKRNLTSAVEAPAKTFAYQNKLPRLPVLDLAYTFPKYLKSVEPFGTPEELAQTKKWIDDFVRPGGVGEFLQKKLKERDARETEGSWLSEWWAGWAYLEYRDPVVINVSFFYQFETPSPQVTQVGRAADLAVLFMEAKHLIDSENLPADVIKGTPQDMNPYRGVFSSIRRAYPNRDYLTRFTPQESRHIVVARKGLFYAVDVYHPDGSLLNQAEFASQFNLIIASAEKDATSQPKVGLFTAENRDTWAKWRPRLLETVQNRLSLDVIEKACFVVCLDEASPTTDNEEGHLLLHGGGSTVESANRYFDKSINLIVFGNGKAGLIGEHSGVDGYPVTVVTDLVLGKELKGWKEGHLKAQKAQALPSPRLLLWQLTARVHEALVQAATFHDKNVANVELNMLKFRTYGSNFIKTVGVSPDGYVQLAMQLSFYKLHNSLTATYESCSTRKYLAGRTEVGRVVSSESFRWVKSMLDASTPAKEKYDLLKAACDYHVNYMSAASDGKGVDRHILGLKLLASENSVSHPLLNDPLLKKSSYWRLSTSQLPSKYSLTGFGAVVPDGYGIYYNIRDNLLQFNITAYNADPTTSSAKMADTLNKTLLEMNQLFRPFAKEPKAKL